MVEVTLQGVTKTFDDKTAVSNLDLTVGDGEFVVLLGPTGAGKTTTLRLIAGLERADSGKILIGGVDASDLPPAPRNIAFVFQQYSLYPHYSAYDNMAFPLRAPGLKFSKTAVDQRVREVAKLLRIEGKLKNRATQLSGGEMQRVAIGRALVREPTIFLMDEPLSSLDAKLREDLRVELKRIQHDLGATILYVTHDQLEAMTLADRIGVLSDGKLVQIGTPREIYEAPANIHVARRLGSPQINIMDVSLLGITGVTPEATHAGVRAEDVLLRRQGGSPATVLAVEQLGAESVLLLEADGTRLHALLGAMEDFAVGDRTEIAVRPGKAIYFDGKGDRIAMPATGPEREASYGT